MRRVATFAAMVLLLSGATTLASAGGEGAGPPRRTRPAKGVGAAMAEVLEGDARFFERDLSGALSHYRKAATLAPKWPLPKYLLGEAYASAQRLDEAEAAFLAARAIEGAHEPLRSHVLFALADCLEREKKWPEARAAWLAFASHAVKVGDAGALSASAVARIAVIDASLARDDAYAAVRRRIAAENDGGGAARSGVE